MEVSPTLRIIGGTPVFEPIGWMASLQARLSPIYYYSHICGGSLIDPTHVLTAAHCILNEEIGVERATSSNFRVAIGGLLQTDTMGNNGFEYREVSAVYCHPGYDEIYKRDDICILELATPTFIPPVELNVPSEFQTQEQVWANELPGTNLTLYGWGLTDENDDNSVSNILNEVEVPIISRAVCASIYGQRAVTNGMLCAGYLAEGGKDACQGDSGGPAVAENGVQVGITSYGAGCAVPGMPGVYTKISAYADFISGVLNGQNPRTTATGPPSASSGAGSGSSPVNSQAATAANAAQSSSDASALGWDKHTAMLWIGTVVLSWLL